MLLARAAREIHRIVTAAEHPHQVLRERLVALTVVSVGVDAIGSVLMLGAERGARGTEITNLGDAAFFTTAQLLTISSQMANPLTTQGRIVDLGLEFYGLAIVSSLAAAMASFLIHRERDRRIKAGVEPHALP